MEPARNTDASLLAVQQALIDREPIFHRVAPGTSRAAFAAMVTDDFWETGASGARYSREHVLDVLVARHAQPIEESLHASDFFCQRLAVDLYLLTYTLRQGARVTRRATLWRQRNDRWLIEYHQGTVVA